MNPTEGARALEEVASQARANTNPDCQPLHDAAKSVAALIRANASRAGHSIAVRVVEKGDGVRLTVTGRHAGRYQTLAARELDARMPGAKAEIRAQVTRRAK